MAKRKKKVKGFKFPYRDAVMIGGTVGALSAVAPSGAPAYVMLTPMAYHWYKTRGTLKKHKLKKVM